MAEIRRIAAGDADFDAAIEALARSDAAERPEVRAAAQAICDDVAQRGDAAVLEYTRRFDHLNVAGAADLEIGADDRAAAWHELAADDRAALQQAHDRIAAFAEQQTPQSWRMTEPDGTVLGEVVTPVDRAGLYVPGGKASYPSSVLMNAVPAKVAGVGELVMVAPTPGGAINPWVLAAAHVAGVDRVFTIGGAQAIAAMAYGTATIPAVDVIVGPGNAYVTAAKRIVFGRVGIDKLAGPSEILVICDGDTNPDWIALDLFSQAEHDEDAQSVLVSPDAAFLDAVDAAIDRLLPTQPRADIIRAALAARGALVQVANLQQAAQVSNRLAPEHLELSVADPEALLSHIRHAGAVFMGRYTPEAFGDYCAGPNHVLPTGGAARFSSPLGVADFCKRSSIIHASAAGARSLGALSARLARAEGLEAHAQSAEVRSGKPPASG